MSQARPNSQSKSSRFPWILSIAMSILVVALVGFGVSAIARTGGPTIYSSRVVNEFPHDPKAYCQGLAFGDGVLYEGTGQYGESVLREVDLKTGKPVKQVKLDERLFGEGITVWGDLIYQVTWKRHVGYVYDRKTFKLKDQFRIAGQGWGLTHDDKHLILSDGTANLRFIDPKKRFTLAKRLTVKDRGRPVRDLNELEYINGEIWANVWFKDYIVRISPKNGQVLGIVDLSHLYPRRQRPARDAVLNGIAYDEQKKRLFVTGKNWPKLFEVKITPR